jgi:hypothetical protein
MAKTVVLERYPHPDEAEFPTLRIELRSNSTKLQAVAFIKKRTQQESMRTTDLATAFRLSKDWYRKKLRAAHATAKQTAVEGILRDPTVAEVYASYLASLPEKGYGQRKVAYVEQKWGPIAFYWEAIPVANVGKQTFKDFYKRSRQPQHGKRPVKVKPHTLHKDVTLIRQVLKHAIEEGHLDHLPPIPSPGVISENPQPWLTQNEWEELLRVSRERIESEKNPRTKGQRIDLDDWMRFMVATMVRVEDLETLTFAKCKVERHTKGHKRLLLYVTGKKPLGPVIGQQEAALVFERRWREAEAAGGKKTDLVFPHKPRGGFTELVKAANLWVLEDKESKWTRNLKSLRATAIAHYLINHPKTSMIFVAANSRTRIDTIERFYVKKLGALMAADELSELTDDDKKLHRRSMSQQAEQVEQMKVDERQAREQSAEYEREEGWEPEDEEIAQRGLLHRFKK